MKKLIIGAIALLCCVNGANANNPPLLENVNSIKIVGGKCQKLSMLGDDLIDVCPDRFFQMFLKDNRVIYMIPLNIGEETVFFAMSGTKSQKPSLNRYTLFLDAMRTHDEENNIVTTKIVGTCEMWGNMDKEKALHQCTGKDIEGDKVIFEFQSVPNQIELIK